ncbi:hypothetical protein HUN01_03150 [Nostoc edaphicum CCNP1411]|uniref:Uncharacterized protein n=1 Tax=Nostoc edaphicum CCNP1411 TaxID=1472755 RepID=A0A7D7LBV3_9NOSO|nr:hypothetical protein [Nostoc edaphicum]QMS86612.1 hypothetical protein HUN01_03150 [Nostoc edaphicum CCNP1411]
MQVDATKVQVDATKVQTDATKVQVNATKVQTDATKVQVDATKVQTDATKVQVDATKVQTDATKSVKPRDAINRRQDKGLIIVETAIYRVFVIENFHQKALTKPYWVQVDAILVSA